ncbi:MAG: PSD1 domain-containing protein [Planctomycetia bacterium]|nr:PSD1 domain-containing protein [Planctomycetia bacterium]
MSPRSFRHGWVGISVLAICLRGAPIGAAEPPQSPAANKKIDFARDVRPIFEARCFTCHGEKRQESDFRLDRGDDALRGGANGAAIVAGKGNASPLVERISGADPDLRMPPKGELLTAALVSVVRSWIDQGAAFPADLESSTSPKPDHWSLQPLVRPPIPPVEESPSVKNPIDAFVIASLSEHGLRPSAEADRRTLIRRVAVDLTGLPPTPREVATFLGDSTSDAYERLVDRLLASPRYGERWARHWMDVVHFAETHGHDQDRPRDNAWPYRDYLIRSFNDDKPYARFVSEQVAGDALYPDEPQATVALGFLAAGPWDESSLMSIVDDTLDKKMAQVLDRDDMITNVMSTFTSTTVHCARCHNHKFDPITQADYYGLQAVFAGVDRADHEFDPDPAVHRQRRLLSQKKHDATTCAAERLLSDAQLQSELVTIEEAFRRSREVWKILVPTAISTANGSTATPEADGSLLFGGPRPEKDTYTLTLETELDAITGVQLEVLADSSLPHQGPGRQDNGNLHLSEFKLSAAPAAGGEMTPVAIASAFADFNQESWGVAAAIDGKPETAWGIHPEVGKDHAAVFVLREPLRTTGGTRLTVVLEQLHGSGHLIGRPRLSVTTAANPESARPIPAELTAILAVSPAERTAAQKVELARSLVGWQLDRQLAALRAPRTVYAACNDFKANGNFRPAARPRPIHMLRRGDINQPLEEAAPGALACVTGIDSRFALDGSDDEASRRAALSRWLVDPRNVLTWRSIVNRVWHYHFDRGIVDTPNDLGRMGGTPSHPALLDWLAIVFRDDGGSLKKLHRLIVTSATYRQSSEIDAERARVDGDNRLLWRMNRHRLDAESIRDAVLQASGKLDLTMGGPSVKQFIQSAGIHVTPNVDYQNYDVDAPDNFRRSAYRFLFRTLPDPLMESLDCPDGSQLAPVRSSSVTALQALSLLDNRFIVRQSEHTAARLTAAAATQAERIRLLFQLALLRDPTPQEGQRWEAYAASYGLANACRMMFNTNEFVFVN